MPVKQWILAEPITEAIIRKFPDYNPVLLQLLWNRGLRSQYEFDVYLEPIWDRDVHKPQIFKNMKEAVDRVFHALKKNQVITVHGDYDADGVCGSAIVLTTLRDICRKLSFDETKIRSFIPHREKDGYGVSVTTIDRLNDEEQTKLLITVDCGISNKPAIDRAKELGIDTIICDHHAVPEDVPDAIIIHPQVKTEIYPNKNLCGAGVAYKLAVALIHEVEKKGSDLGPGYEKWLLDLVAIATVTDVMDLRGENRALEKFGLIVLNKTRRPGLKKLIEVAGLTDKELNAQSIGFQIGPRLNAAGRMRHAHEALDLFLEEDPYKIHDVAAQLNQTNIDRQKASGQMYEEAKEMVGEIGDRKVVIVYRQDWPAGLIGLVAGKLVRDYNLPVYVVSQDKEKFVGSGRSVAEFNVTEALNVASEHLDRFGGHPEACGFSVEGEEKFKKAVATIENYAAENLKEVNLSPKIEIDAEIFLEDINIELYQQIKKMKPFGKGNAEPVFSSKKVEIAGWHVVGKDGKHLKLRLRSIGGRILTAIAFGQGSLANSINLQTRADLVYYIDVNEWNGNSELQLRIDDIKI